MTKEEFIGILSETSYTAFENICGDVILRDNDYIMLLYLSSQDNLLVTNERDNPNYTRTLSLILDKIGVEHDLKSLFTHTKTLLLDTKGLIS